MSEGRYGSRTVTRAESAEAMSRMLGRSKQDGRRLTLTIGQRAHITGRSVAELRRMDRPSDPNPFPRFHWRTR